MSNALEPHIDSGDRTAMDASSEAASSPEMGQILAALRRHWLTVVLIWPLLLGPALAGIWHLKERTYTARAKIVFSPTLPRILYKDESNGMMPMFDSYLRTQADMVMSYHVLRAALEDPYVKGLPLYKRPDAIDELRRSLDSRAVPGTHLVQISVTRENRIEAEKIGTAVVQAFKEYFNDSEKDEAEETIRLLTEEEKRLTSQLEAKRKERDALAQTFKTTSEDVLDLLRENSIKVRQDAEQNLRKADLEWHQLEDQIAKIEEGGLEATLEAEVQAWEAEAIENDPLIRSLQRQLLERSAELVRFDDPRSRYVEATRKQIEGLKQHLEAAREDIRKELASKEDDFKKNRKQQILDTLKRELEAAKIRRDALQESLTQYNEQELNIGTTSLAIQRLQEQIDWESKNLELVRERLHQLEIEGKRPVGRIAAESPVQILPEDAADKRYKWSAAAGGGTLFLALMTALVRDRINPRLHAPQEVKTSTGLLPLGAVFSIQDLKSKRVTKQDLAECFRVIRTKLDAIQAGGRPLKSILITSAQASEGKTSLAISLAASLVEAGNRVLLIDGDIQAPQIGKTLKLTSSKTLKQVLRRQCSLAEAALPTRLPGLHVLTTATNGSSARGALDSQSAARLVGAACDRYDRVIIDSPPVLGAADALVWAQAVDGVIVSTFAGRSSVRLVREACHQLRSAGAPAVGGVVCNLRIGPDHYPSSYSTNRSTRPDARGKRSRKKRHPQPAVSFPLADQATGEDDPQNRKHSNP